MLIDFTVENYRSIKTPVTLSAVAQSRSAAETARNASGRRIKPDNEIAPPYEVEGWGFELLPVLGIFGANASGKSNVMRAMDDLLAYMFFGAAEGYRISQNFIPFMLYDACLAAPTSFKMRVAVEQTIYTYRLRLNRERVLLERLDYAQLPSKRDRLLYQRLWDESRKVYLWKNGSDFTGPHTQLQSSLKENEPFISLLAERLNVEVIKPLTAWLVRPPGVNQNFENVEDSITLEWIHGKPEYLKIASELIRYFDTGIADIETFKTETKPGETGLGNVQTVAWHDTDSGRVWLPLFEESTGTQRLFRIARRMLAAFKECGFLLEDELDSSLHPNIVRAIVRMFQNPKINPKRAQLIFTSHDNTLQSRNLLRRDQIWFTEKRADGSTSLYALSDFKPRNDAAIDKNYLEGRYGAVPVLPNEEELAEILGGHS